MEIVEGVKRARGPNGIGPPRLLTAVVVTFWVPLRWIPVIDPTRDLWYGVITSVQIVFVNMSYFDMDCLLAMRFQSAHGHDDSDITMEGNEETYVAFLAEQSKK